VIGKNCLLEIVALGSILFDLTSVSSDFGPSEPRPPPAGATELPNFFKML
jgi:hypothetical protein